MATPFVQGQLLDKDLSCTVETSCAVSGRSFVIELESDLSYRVRVLDAEQGVLAQKAGNCLERLGVPATSVAASRKCLSIPSSGSNPSFLYSSRTMIMATIPGLNFPSHQRRRRRV